LAKIGATRSSSHSRIPLHSNFARQFFGTEFSQKYSRFFFECEIAPYVAASLWDASRFAERSGYNIWQAERLPFTQKLELLQQPHYFSFRLLPVRLALSN